MQPGCQYMKKPHLLAGLLAILNISPRGTMQKALCCIAMPKNILLIEFAGILVFRLTWYKIKYCTLGWWISNILNST